MNFGIVFTAKSILNRKFDLAEYPLPTQPNEHCLGELLVKRVL